MKKFFKNILFAFILLPAIMFMAACTDGENPPPQYPEQPIAITSEMIALEYTSTVYNGSEKMGEFCNLCKIVLLLILPLFREKSN